MCSASTTETPVLKENWSGGRRIFQVRTGESRIEKEGNKETDRLDTSRNVIIM